MMPDRVDGVVKRSHTTDNVNEILFSDDEDVVPSKIEKPTAKEKSNKKGTKPKSSSGTRKSSRKTTKEVKTEIMDISE